MGKPPRKGTSVHKPPVPVDDHGVIADWISKEMPTVQPMLARIDEIIHEELDDLAYAVKWTKAYYQVPDHGWVIELAGYHKSVNIVFHGGEDFDAPPPLGDDGSDRTRYIKLHDLDEIDADDVRAWIANAGKVPGWS